MFIRPKDRNDNKTATKIGKNYFKNTMVIITK